MTNVNQRDGSPSPRKSPRIASFHTRSEAPSRTPASNSAVLSLDEVTMHAILCKSVRPLPTSPRNDTSTPLSSIGKLPIELRNLIYKLLLPPQRHRPFFVWGRSIATLVAGYFTATALTSSSSVFLPEMHPLVYACRYITFISSPTSLEMRIDNQRVDLSVINEHKRLYKLDIHALTIYLQNIWLLNDYRKHRKHIVHFRDFFYALKCASSIRCIHVRFAAKQQHPHIPDVARL